MALMIWETTGVLRVVARKGDRDQIFTSYYKSQYHTLCLVTEGLLAWPQGLVLCSQKHI